MAFSTGPWESPEGALGAGEYCQVCLIDENPAGREKVKSLCKLPIRARPGVAVNVNAMHAAAGALAGARGGVSASAEGKRSAARRLLRLYGEAGETAPDSLKRVAG
jgi:hypothetical protein